MGWNDHLPELDGVAAGFALKAGAITICERHGDVTISKGNPDAESRAYALATNAWKAGGIECTREELMEAVKNTLEEACDDGCPECRKIMDE
ncbi:hypothetical protein [Xanthobacter autotrophicus]|uniref:hypothetical protein n=1 Tax=Xanthobacter autotrophicus TaxID=280 RepID=UPI00372A9A36